MKDLFQYYHLFFHLIVKNNINILLGKRIISSTDVDIPFKLNLKLNLSLREILNNFLSSFFSSISKDVNLHLERQICNSAHKELTNPSYLEISFCFIYIL